jgi:hypothetical protein
MPTKSKVVSLAEIKRKQMIAQYMKFYGNASENTRKATK